MSAEIIPLQVRQSALAKPPIMVVVCAQHPHILQVKLYSMVEFLDLLRNKIQMFDQYHQLWQPPFSFIVHCRDGLMAVYWVRDQYEAEQVRGRVGSL